MTYRLAVLRLQHLPLAYGPDEVAGLMREYGVRPTDVSIVPSGGGRLAVDSLLAFPSVGEASRVHERLTNCGCKELSWASGEEWHQAKTRFDHLRLPPLENLGGDDSRAHGWITGWRVGVGRCAMRGGGADIPAAAKRRRLR